MIVITSTKLQRPLLSPLLTNVEMPGFRVHFALSRPTGKSRIHAMRKLPVAPICRTSSRLRRRANHNDPVAHPASMKRDVSADRHDTWGGDAMDADGTSDERGGRGRRNRVVLIPRRWDQASRETFRGERRWLTSPDTGESAP